MEKRDSRKGKATYNVVIFGVLAVMVAGVIGYWVVTSTDLVSSQQNKQIDRSLEGVELKLAKQGCRSNRDNYCNVDVEDLPDPCPTEELDQNQLWSCNKKTGRGTEENPFYCYEVWASKGGGGIEGIPSCSGN